MNQKIDNLKEGDLILVIGFKPEIGVFKRYRKDKNQIVSITFESIYSNYTIESRINTRHSKYQRIYKITEDNLNPDQYAQYEKIKNRFTESIVIFNNGRYKKIPLEDIKNLYIAGNFNKLTDILLMSNPHIIRPDAEKIIIYEIRAKNLHYKEVINIFLSAAKYQDKIV